METECNRALVLVVDDDLLSARILARLLREDGFDVELVGDGATAIGRLARRPMPDVLITDLRMPYVDGLAVAEYARSRTPGLPIFVLTGYPNALAPLDDLAPPPTVFPKPVDYPGLISSLRGAVCERTEPRGAVR